MSRRGPECGFEEGSFSRLALDPYPSALGLNRHFAKGQAQANVVILAFFKGLRLK